MLFYYLLSNRLERLEREGRVRAVGELRHRPVVEGVACGAEEEHVGAAGGGADGGEDGGRVEGGVAELYVDLVGCERLGKVRGIEERCGGPVGRVGGGGHGYTGGVGGWTTRSVWEGYVHSTACWRSFYDNGPPSSGPLLSDVAAKVSSGGSMSPAWQHKRSLFHGKLTRA